MRGRSGLLPGERAEGERYVREARRVVSSEAEWKNREVLRGHIAYLSVARLRCVCALGVAC